jgi:hypothetical protein
MPVLLKVTHFEKRIVDQAFYQVGKEDRNLFLHEEGMNYSFLVLNYPQPTQIYDFLDMFLFIFE